MVTTMTLLGLRSYRRWIHGEISTEEYAAAPAGFSLVADRPRCPHCGSPDVARYRWPDDPVTRHYLEATPEARLRMTCLDCRETFDP